MEKNELYIEIYCICINSRWTGRSYLFCGRPSGMMFTPKQGPTPHPEGHFKSDPVKHEFEKNGIHLKDTYFKIWMSFSQIHVGSKLFIVISPMQGVRLHHEFFSGSRIGPRDPRLKKKGHLVI